MKPSQGCTIQSCHCIHHRSNADETPETDATTNEEQTTTSELATLTMTINDQQTLLTAQGTPAHGGGGSHTSSSQGGQGCGG